MAQQLASAVVNEVCGRCDWLICAGLHYLSVRHTCSSGEISGEISGVISGVLSTGVII